MPFNGGGFSGGGFGRTNAGVGAADWGAAPSGLSQQATGVAAYGNVWASKNCAPCDTAIRQLQAALRVPADGKVGAGTANAVAAVAAAAQRAGMAGEAFQLARVGNSPELVAKNADWLLPIVQLVMQRTAAVAAQTAPTTFPVVTGAGSTPMSPPAPQLPPGVQANASPAMFSLATFKAKLPYIIGAAILVAGGIAVYFIVTPPAPREEP